MLNLFPGFTRPPSRHMLPLVLSFLPRLSIELLEMMSIMSYRFLRSITCAALNQNKTRLDFAGAVRSSHLVVRAAGRVSHAHLKIRKAPPGVIYAALPEVGGDLRKTLLLLEAAVVTDLELKCRRRRRELKDRWQQEVISWNFANLRMEAHCEEMEEDCKFCASTMAGVMTAILWADRPEPGPWWRLALNS